MAAVHGTTKNWIPCEFPIIKTEIDLEADMDYPCTFNTHGEPDIKDETNLPPRSIESLFSDNIPFQVNDRAHINIIDMYEQAFSEYQAFFIYEDLFSKYVVLRPLKEVPGSVNSVPEIVNKLLDIFSLIGAPRIIESSNGRSFAEMLVRELSKRVPSLKTIHGSLSRQNYSRKDFKTLAQSWQIANPSRLWHEGLHFIQVHENICNFSSSQSETSQNSPAEVFFKANLVNDLVRFVSDNNFIEAVDEVWTEEESLRRNVSHESSIPSLLSFNNFIDSNDEKENVDCYNSINSIKNEILSQTEKDSIDFIDDASYKSWTEEKCLDKIMGNNLCENLAEEKLDTEREIVKFHKYEKAEYVHKSQTNTVNDETCYINVKSHKSSILTPIYSNVIVNSHNEEKNAGSSNLIHSVKNIVLSETGKNSIDTNKYNVSKNDTFKCHICERIFGKMCNLMNHMRSHKTTLKSDEMNANDTFSEVILETNYDENRKAITNSHPKFLVVNVKKEDESDVENGINIVNRRRCSSHISLSFNKKTKKLKNSRIKSYQCYICENQYPSAYTLRRHINAIHQSENIYKCEICAKMFKYLSVLTRHKSIHSNERPLKCHLCKKRFKRKLDLNYHLTSHSDLRAFECDMCKRTFKQKRCLQLHIIYVHQNIRRFKCDICKTTVHRKPDLQRHILSVHGDIRPFECDICKATFNRKEHLQRHIVFVHKI